MRRIDPTGRVMHVAFAGLDQDEPTEELTRTEERLILWRRLPIRLAVGPEAESAALLVGS